MFIITTDHAGIPDIVEDGVNGIAIQKNKADAKQTYAIIIKLSCEDLRETLVKNRKIVTTRFNQKNYIGNVERVFEKI